MTSITTTCTALNPKETIEYMKRSRRPWVAFKVLAAGSIRPEVGFSYALRNGADFIIVGMFDFQVARNVGAGGRDRADATSRAIGSGWLEVRPGIRLAVPRDEVLSRLHHADASRSVPAWIRGLLRMSICATNNCGHATASLLPKGTWSFVACSGATIRSSRLLVAEGQIERLGVPDGCHRLLRPAGTMIETIAGFRFHRGMLGCGLRRPSRDLSGRHCRCGDSATVVVCCGRPGSRRIWVGSCEIAPPLVSIWS